VLRLNGSSAGDHAAFPGVRTVTVQLQPPSAAWAALLAVQREHGSKKALAADNRTVDNPGLKVKIGPLRNEGIGIRLTASLLQSKEPRRHSGGITDKLSSTCRENQ